MRYRASQRHSPRSRRVVALCVCLVVAGCAAPTDSEPPAAEVVEQDGSEAWDEVVMAHKALIAAYQIGDVEAFVAMLDPAPGIGRAPSRVTVVAADG